MQAVLASKGFKLTITSGQSDRKLRRADIALCDVRS